MAQVPVDLEALDLLVESTRPADSLQADTQPEDLDVSLTEYSVKAQIENTWYTVPCSALAWEEQTKEIATRITARFPDDVLEGDGRRLASVIQPGTPISVTAALGNSPEFTEVVRGTIEEMAPNDGSGGTFEVIAYDPIKVLLSSKVDEFYEAGMSAAAIITKICADHHVPTGELHPLLESIVMPKPTIAHAQTIADVVMKTLADAQAQLDSSSERLVIKTRGGRLIVDTVGNNKPIYWLTQGDLNLPGNVSSVRERFSISELITQVLVTGKAINVGKPPEVTTLTANDLRYGTRTEIWALTEHLTPQMVRDQAHAILNQKGVPRHDRSIVAPDVPTIRKFDQIRVSAGTLDGFFSVESITHDEASRMMTISLGTLKFDVVDSTFSEFHEDAIPPEQSVGGGTGGRVTDAQLYALAKAAGFTGSDAIVAVAVSLAENSTSNPSAKSPKNNNGTYDLGLWQINSSHWAAYGGETNLVIPLENAKAAYDIFRQGGWGQWATYPSKYGAYMDRATAASKAPEVPVPTGTAFTQQGAAGSPNSAIVAEMNRWINVPYQLGGNSKAGIDCSGFTQAVFKSVGVNLPRTAQTQWNAVQHIPSPQFGDLVFFQGTGGTDYITHVGIVVGPGVMMSAVDPHVKQTNFNTPWWKAHLVGFGRVPVPSSGG